MFIIVAMDIRLETFLVVTETKNYTLASKELGLTQPAVSQHIKSLEQEYDVKLFTRKNHEMTLTKEGEIMLKYALRIMALYSEVERKITYKKNNTNILNIGVTHTSESNITPEILAKYSKKKGLHIKIISDTTKNLYDMLSDYHIDLAIIEGEIASKKFSSRVLGSDSLMVMLSPDNSLSKKEFITIDDLKKENLIIRPIESGTTTLFKSELEKKNMSLDEFNIFLEMDNVASIKDLLMKNLGVSILPKSACQKDVDDGHLVALPIKDLNLERKTSLVYLDNIISENVLNELVKTYQNM